VESKSSKITEYEPFCKGERGSEAHEDKNSVIKANTVIENIDFFKQIPPYNWILSLSYLNFKFYAICFMVL
jgi:hypothetical protein